MNFPRRLVITVSFVSGFFLNQSIAQDSSSKSGIDLLISGQPGVTYSEEYFYHDRMLNDRKVIYIRDDALITLRHNFKNVAAPIAGTSFQPGVNGADGVPGSGDEGIIRYRVDGDLNYGYNWSGSNGGSLPAYSAPFSFSGLTYPGGGSIVGSTGPKPGVEITDKSNFYWRGCLDRSGDEWHLITVADDDHWLASANSAYDSEHWASDGKVFLFVVNPKTPCLSWSSTGDGQFYTTPPKSYFIPKIHDQTTYFDEGGGGISVTIRDINGNRVYYRIVEDVEDSQPAFVNAGDSSVTLSHSDFSVGRQYLQFYYEGREGNIKTRCVVRKPDFPSGVEFHGNLLWKDADGWAEVQSRFGRYPYNSVLNNMKSSNSYHHQSSIDEGYRNGFRTDFSGAAQTNAFVAKVMGIEASASGKSKTYALYAKEALLDNIYAIDPVGFELPHSGSPIPARELIYRGYYDVDSVYSGIIAYDLLISMFRSDQHSDGITPIEDYLIRDYYAAFNVRCLMQMGKFNTAGGGTPTGGGMWEISRRTGGLMAAMAMPSYSTEYYGTSGFDGNTDTYLWTPFPYESYTWKKLYLDNDHPLNGYPNVEQRFGIEEGLFSPEGHFIDRVGYFNFALTGHCVLAAANLIEMYYPGYDKLPNMEAGVIRAKEGSLIGLKNMEGPARYSCITALNGRFEDPALTEATIAWMKGLSGSHEQSEGKSFLRAGVMGFAWYEDDFVAGEGDVTPPSIPSNLRTTYVGGTRIDLEWAEASDDRGVISYRIYVNGSLHGTVSGEENAYPISGLNGSSDYDLQVSAVDAAGNESELSATLNVMTEVFVPSGSKALMLDFGPVSPIGSEANSPGHYTGSVSGEEIYWNVVGTSAGMSGSVSNLKYADGSDATGVSFTYGASSQNLKIISYSAGISSSSVLGSATGSGIYLDASVARDGIWNGSGSNNDYSIGLRVDGLSPGDYELFIMARNTNSGSAGAEMNAYVMTGVSSIAYDYSADDAISILNDSTASWVEGSNYGYFEVSLWEGESLFLALDGAVDTANRGFLNALQLVSTSESSITWGDRSGYPNGDLDTGTSLGWLNVQYKPWVWSYSLERWFYGIEPTVGVGYGTWFFIPTWHE